jgi:hypothetical protein
MAKFKKKEIVIEAEQWSPDTFPTPAGVQFSVAGGAFVWNSNQQRIFLNIGDWIIPHPDGGYYLLNDVIFRSTYDPM